MRAHVPWMTVTGAVVLAAAAASLGLGTRASDRRAAAADPTASAAVAARAAEQPDRSLEPTVATIRILLGLRDSQPTAWDGRIEAQGARMVGLRGWRFGADMAVSQDERAWKCGTWLGPAPRRRPFDIHLPDRMRPFVRPGLLVHIAAAEGLAGRLRVATARGEFAVDLNELQRRERLEFLGGAAAAELAVGGRVAAGSDPPPPVDAVGPWFDFPSIAANPASPGEVVVAYQQYCKDEGDRVYARRRRPDGRWSPPELLTPQAGDVYHTAAAFDGQGAVWVVYAAQVNGNWDLYGRRRDGRGWGPEQRLTRSPQPDLHHQLVRGRRGDVWLVWQAFRGGQSDIAAMRWDGRSWSRPLWISDHPANDWSPAACATPDGGLAVVWDTYRGGDYDVFCRLVSGGDAPAPGRLIQVTGESTLEARPTVACDAAGRLWVAYDMAGAHWGKDTGFWLELGAGRLGEKLYEQRRIGLRLVDPQTGEVLQAPQAAPDFPVNLTINEHVEYPRLATDSQGRIWLFYRHRSALDLSRRNIGRRFQWELLVRRFDAARGRWSPPRLLVDSMGRLDMAVAADAAGSRLWAAWPCDHRPFGGARRPDACSVLVGSIRLDVLPPAAAPSLAAAPVTSFPPKAPDPAHPHERRDVAAIRDYRIELGGATLRIFRGDMHRHTENSPDGGGDGSLLDAYRYAMDAAAMDFLLVTDHNDGGREYDWWLREKSNDLFRVGEAFVGLYGYERSVSYPNGHRNVFFTRRGVRPLDIDPRERARGDKRLNSGAILYPYLRRYGGICFSHTSGTGMGTDWRDNDPELEPLVEIFQGDRTSYERLEAPWAALPDRPSTQEGGFRPLGYVNLALKKGYRLGFQASSDHLSTHLSYSCILAERNTREALMDAMRKRHAYAATDNIILDVRSEGLDGPTIMGDVFASRGAPKLHIRVFGTAPLRELAVIKNDHIVYSVNPAGSQARVTFVDADAQPGEEAYYYVRVQQEDERLAWSSPMWITPR